MLTPAEQGMLAAKAYDAKLRKSKTKRDYVRGYNDAWDGCHAIGNSDYEDGHKDGQKDCPWVS